MLNMLFQLNASAWHIADSLNKHLMVYSIILFTNFWNIPIYWVSLYIVNFPLETVGTPH